MVLFRRPCPSQLGVTAVGGERTLELTPTELKPILATGLSCCSQNACTFVVLALTRMSIGPVHDI